MKKALCLVAMLLVTTLLVACGNNGNDSGGNVTTSGFTRGTWSGNVFTNNQLGVTFTMPAGWVAATDAEMAAVMGLGVDMMGLDMTPEMLELAGVTTVQDMMASNPTTGAMVQIMAERLVFPNTRISTADYIQQMSDMLIEVGMGVNTDFPNVTVGSRSWHVFESVMEIMPGFSVYGYYLVDVSDGFALTVQIVHSPMSESLDEILAMFN